MAASVALIRQVRRRASFRSREAQSPLAPSPQDADVAAWEADAIEPDVPSSRGSFYASIQSSTTSTDGESSPCSSRRRFRSLRVSIRRRRRKTFQYHVPVHLLAPTPFSSTGAGRRRESSALSRHRQYHTSTTDTSTPGDDDADMLASFSSSTTAASHRESLASSSSHSHRRSDLEGWRAWGGPTKHAVLESLSDAEDAPDPLASRPDAVAIGSSAASRRQRAWSKLKAHAPRLPRLSRSSAASAKPFKSKSTEPADGLFSISFYPWKMEARGYYSTPEAAVEWVPDTASACCQLCAASFTLARRRHHCRLCGRLVCNDCSRRRTFLPIAELQRAAATHRSLIKSGEPQRSCDSCVATLARMAAQHDHRVKQLCVDTRPSGGPPTHATARASDLSDRPLHLARPRGLSKASLARHDELDQVLRARASSRAAGAGTLQHVVSSQWLEQWLQFVQVDAGSERHSQLGRPSVASSRGSVGSRRRSTRFAAGRRPGPIANYELLDFVNGKLVPRAGLRRSRGADGPGDFHVISHDVWLVFLRLYGGGPCITIDDDPPSHPRTTTRSHLMLHADADGDASPFDDDFGKPPPLPKWNITELDATDVTANATPPTAAATTTTTPVPPVNEFGKSFMVNEQRPERVLPRPDSQQLTMRPQATSEFDTAKSSASRRPASATAIAMPPVVGPPVGLSRSTSESHRPLTGSDHDAHGRRKSLTFIGYLKKWRQGDDTPSASSRPSGASTTFSHVDDDGVVLYDPAKLTGPDRASEVSQTYCDDDRVDFSRSCGPEQQRETIAAVSAFAAAAAEARRKSTMSLIRHSTALTTSAAAPRTTTSSGVQTA